MDKDIFYGYNPSFRDVPVCKANNGAVPYVSFGVLLIFFLMRQPLLLFLLFESVQQYVYRRESERACTQYNIHYGHTHAAAEEINIAV